MRLPVCQSTAMLEHTLLVLLLTQYSIQGGVRPQSGTLDRLAPSRGAALGGTGLGAKLGGAGVLGARGYGGAKAGKTGTGRYLGAGGYRPLGTRGGVKQGFGTPLAGYGTGLGMSLGAGPGLSNGMALGLAPQVGRLGGRGYGAGVYPGRGGAKAHKPARTGYGLGAAGYPAAGLANGYGAGLGPAAYPQAGKLGFGSVYGVNGYGHGYSAGLGAGGFGTPGLGLGLSSIPDAKAGKYGGATAGSVLGAAGGQAVVSAGLGPQSKVGSYGGAPYVGQRTGLGPDTTLGGAGGPVLEPVTGGEASQLLYNGAPVIPAGLEGDNGYSYGPQQLSLGTDGRKLSYDDGREYRAQPAGYDAALGPGGIGLHGASKEASQYDLGGFYGNRIKG
ncbi:spidroin-1 isoform X4 [Electrophorus electricus]|uniref:spidroin-1 isoform X4 n=1 Tax=Electrophorus electricus TaxID=8005 RepID=UPI0015D06E3F|nr:spidroin-1 isoform X4 [Electrophorus electricus]